MAKETALPPFYRAARQGSVGQLECFIKAGVSPDTPNSVVATQSGDTALYLAVLNDQPATLQLLLNYGAKGGNTALHQSVLARKPHLVRTLLGAGANPKLANEVRLMQKKQYPMHLAAKGAFPEIVEILLAYSPESMWMPDINSKDPWEYCKTKEMKDVFIRFYMWRLRKVMILLKPHARVLAPLPLPLFRSAVEYL